MNPKELAQTLATLKPEQVDALKDEIRAAYTAAEANPDDLAPAGMVAAGHAASLVSEATGAVAKMARRGRPTPSPEAQRAPSGTGTGLIAAGGAVGATPGEALGDRWRLGEVLSETLSSMDRHGPARGKAIIASARWHYPEGRRLGEERTQT